jgi:hypothetical protein
MSEKHRRVERSFSGWERIVENRIAAREIAQPFGWEQAARQ